MPAGSELNEGLGRGWQCGVEVVLVVVPRTGAKTPRNQGPDEREGKPVGKRDQGAMTRD